MTNFRLKSKKTDFYIETTQKTGADINYANPGTGWTPLHAATFREQGPVVMHLLQQGIFIVF